MSDKTQINLLRIRAYDAEFNESDHPRADNGQFTSGGGGGGAKKSKPANSKYQTNGIPWSDEMIARKKKEEKWERASKIKLTDDVKRKVTERIQESYGFDSFITRLNHETQKKYGEKCWPDYAPVPGTMKLKKLNKRVFESSLSPGDMSWDHNVDYVVECEFQDQGRGPGWKKGPKVKKQYAGSFAIDPQSVKELGLAKSYDDFMKEPK